MQTNSLTAPERQTALSSLLACRDRAQQIARQQRERLRSIRAAESIRHPKENRHD